MFLRNMNHKLTLVMYKCIYKIDSVLLSVTHIIGLPACMLLDIHAFV